jgi:AraC-like DNA-binding protein/mannose-6-phosphate isomerase-like protein (cupin superfamily)
LNWISYNVSEKIHIDEFFSMFIAEYDKTYIFHGETHPFWECVYVMDGEISVCADSRIYNMSEGDIIFHKPNELHKFNITGGKNSKLFIFSYSLTGELSSYFCEKIFSLSSQQKETIANLLSYMDNHIDKTDIPYIHQYLIPFKKSPVYAQEVTSRIYLLLLSLLENSETLPVSKSRDAAVFSDVVNYMKKSMTEFPTVHEIARNVGISQSGLKRIFQKYAGVSIHKYFLKLKLQCAADMLSDGASVTETAENLGFSSQGYFTKVYKRELGILPSQQQKNRPPSKLI